MYRSSCIGNYKILVKSAVSHEQELSVEKYTFGNVKKKQIRFVKKLKRGSKLSTYKHTQSEYYNYPLYWTWFAGMLVTVRHSAVQVTFEVIMLML